MKDNENKNTQSNEDNEKIHVSQSVFQSARELQQEQARQEAEMQKKIAEREKKRREAYERRILEEKKELLRLKQGAIEESETIHEEKPKEIKLTFWQKVKNFFYHNKWWLGMATVLVLIAGFLIYDLASKERPDLVVMVLAQNDELGYGEHLTDYITQFTEDFNNNGEILASVYYIPYTENINTNYANGIDTKLTVELQSADSMIIIGGDEITEIMSPEDTLVDLEELFPDNPNVDGYKFYLKGSAFAEKLGISEDALTDDLFLAIRKPASLMSASLDDMQEAYDKDFPVFEKIINDLSE